MNPAQARQICNAAMSAKAVPSLMYFKARDIAYVNIAV